jgi:hypothetical protein
MTAAEVGFPYALLKHPSLLGLSVQVKLEVVEIHWMITSK